jgi:hypothetical protein
MKAMFNLIWIISLLQFTTSCKQQPEAETYLIPVGFKGKVNVIFNQPKGDAMKYDNGRRLYEIPINGILLTQFKDEEGVVNHQYYYVDSVGTRQPLTIFLQEDKNSSNDTTGVFRDGTVGVYGNSDNPKSLSYQEFYITSNKDFENYFSQEYQEKFEKKVKEITGYDF